LTVIRTGISTPRRDETPRRNEERETEVASLEDLAISAPLGFSPVFEC
jgi:hypothetical protein